MKLKNLIVLFLLFLSSCAPPPGEGGESGSPLLAALPFILIFGLFYLLILRPQQRQNKQRNLLLKNLKRGDKVITAGGIHGRIINVEEEVVTVEIAKGVNVQVSSSSISGKVDSEKSEGKDKGGKQ